MAKILVLTNHFTYSLYFPFSLLLSAGRVVSSCQWNVSGSETYHFYRQDLTDFLVSLFSCHGKWRDQKFQKVQLQDSRVANARILLVWSWAPSTFLGWVAEKLWLCWVKPLSCGGYFFCSVTKTILTNALGQCYSIHLTWWNKMLMLECKSAHYSLPESLTMKRRSARLKSGIGDTVDLFSDTSSLPNHAW